MLDTNIILPIILACLAAPGFWGLLQSMFDKLTGRKRVSMEEISDKLDDQGKKIDTLEKSFAAKTESDDEREAKASRRRILRADDEIRMGMRHSKDFFDDVLRDIDYYENYCDEHRHFKNSCAESAIRNVRQTYDKCKAQNDFL
jgi:hypothetical protein